MGPAAEDDMATRKLILGFCFVRLSLAVVLWAAGTADSPAENATLRVMCAVLTSCRSNRQPEQLGGLSA
jgi:hypothetical protein